MRSSVIQARTLAISLVPLYNLMINLNYSWTDVEPQPVSTTARPFFSGPFCYPRPNKHYSRRKEGKGLFVLADELFLYIFSFLDPLDLICGSLVCNEFRRLIFDGVPLQLLLPPPPFKKSKPPSTLSLLPFWILRCSPCGGVSTMFTGSVTICTARTGALLLRWFCSHLTFTPKLWNQSLLRSNSSSLTTGNDGRGQLGERTSPQDGTQGLPHGTY